MNNENRFNLIEYKYRQIVHTIDRLVALPGVSLETINALVHCRTQTISAFRELNEYRNSHLVAQTWSTTDYDFDTVESKLDKLLEQVKALETQSTQESGSFEKMLWSIEVDRTTAREAHKHHLCLSYITLTALGILVVAGAASLLSIFGIVDIWDSRQILEGLLSKLSQQSSGLSASLLIEVALIAGGRVFYLLLLAWAISFMGKLHASHSAQAVTYRDKIVGLDSAKLILNAAANASSRDKVIEQMSSTFLGGSHNAFSGKEVGTVESTAISWLDAVKTALVSRILK